MFSSKLRYGIEDVTMNKPITIASIISRPRYVGKVLDIAARTVIGLAANKLSCKADASRAIGE